jgi:hypothetical protein
LCESETEAADFRQLFQAFKEFQVVTFCFFGCKHNGSSISCIASIVKIAGAQVHFLYSADHGIRLDPDAGANIYDHNNRPQGWVGHSALPRPIQRFAGLAFKLRRAGSNPVGSL